MASATSTKPSQPKTLRTHLAKLIFGQTTAMSAPSASSHARVVVLKYESPASSPGRIESASETVKTPTRSHAAALRKLNQPSVLKNAVSATMGGQTK